MGRTIFLTNGNDSFTQSLVPANFALVIRSLAGNDRIDLNRTDDLGGSNNVQTAGGNDIVINRKEFGNLIHLGDGNDTYFGLGFGSFSTDRPDQVNGGNGNDTFFVQTFKSQYLGAAGNDTFHSVGWQNFFNGGDGIDTLSYLPRSDDRTVGRTGVSVDLNLGVTQTGAFRQERFFSIENVIGSRNGDSIAGSGVANRLTGAEGLDALTGRGGADVFIYNRFADAPVVSGVAEEITDFSRAQGDRVNLHAIDANLNVAGNQDFVFVTGGFTGRAGEVRFDGDLILADGNGDRVADMRILMTGVDSMQASDFIL